MHASRSRANRVGAGAKAARPSAAAQAATCVSGNKPTRARKAVADAAPSVRERILDVAERLFAEYGMTGVGLRAITTEAKVNLASIAYHFGSKDGLLEALFAQRAAPIAEERLRLLALCLRSEASRRRSKQILDAFLRPALTLGVAAAIRRAGLRQAARAARHRAGNAVAQDPVEGLRSVEPQIHRRDRAGAAANAARRNRMALSFHARRHVLHHGQ